MTRNRLHIDIFHEEIQRVSEENAVKDKNILFSANQYLENQLIPRLDKEIIDWQCFSIFWPPRLVNAFENDRLVCFFGAGLSIPSGLPSWHTLLTKYFGLEQSLLSDDVLKTDPLTLAELASHQIGAEQLQVVLRKSMKPTNIPTTTHFITAALRLPFYITTNYDVLFESAWKLINPGIELITLVNDADLQQHTDQNNILLAKGESAYLLKIHGCLNRKDEHLILTRSDYRYHYRANQQFFQCITDLLSTYHVLFLGFSHKDPEVTRLVEDAIYRYEKTFPIPKNNKQKPNFYSLQFGMKSHTPEIFAAWGLVALNTPVVFSDVEDPRSLSLAQALIDLIGATEKNFHKELSLDDTLDRYTNQLSLELQNALNEMSNLEDDAINALVDSSDTGEWLTKLENSLGALAGQGVYLLNEQGRIVRMALPKGLDKDARFAKKSFNERSYFQQAKTFRKPFVSDSIESVFNELSTFFLCVPLTKEGRFVGLLFSACQIGFWETPLKVARDIWNLDKDLSVLLIDSNGVCLLPPNEEFSIEKSFGARNKEKPEANIGYRFDKLLKLSRRDKLISRMMQNVVPLYQDDDVLSLATDLKYYTVVTELKPACWKFGISKSIVLAGS